MAELKIGKITLGMCQTNCYFLFREDSKEVVFVDPAERGQYIYDKLTENGYTVKAILITHGHFDHIMGADELRTLTGAKIYAPAADQELLQDAKANISAMWAEPCTLKADVLFEDGDVLDLGELTCKVIVTPGHTVGSSCFYFEEDKVLISGDTLFEESVGRTDFPTGSMSSLVRSIKEKLFILPDDVQVFPGHGGFTEIGHEKMYNPCV